MGKPAIASVFLICLSWRSLCPHKTTPRPRASEASGIRQARRKSKGGASAPPKQCRRATFLLRVLCASLPIRRVASPTHRGGSSHIRRNPTIQTVATAQLRELAAQGTRFKYSHLNRLPRASPQSTIRSAGIKPFVIPSQRGPRQTSMQASNINLSCISPFKLQPALVQLAARRISRWT